MLKCREVAEQASAYVDGTLPWRTRLAIRLHLAMCGHCSRYVAQMLQTIGLVAKAPPDEVPATDTAAVAEQLAQLRRNLARQTPRE